MEENNKINMPTLAAAIAYTNSHGGGGGGGTSNYNDLSNKPQIGGTTLTGNKSASDLGLVAAVEGKGLSTNDYTDADKAIVGGVTAALAGKQDELTAGSHIAIDDDTISVNRWAVPAGKVVYTVITSDENYGQNVHIQRHTLGGAFIDDRTFLCEMYKTVNIDGLISIQNPYASFNITLLKDSDEQQAGYRYTVNPITTPTSNSFTFLMEQEENANDLIIRSELDAEVNAIKDGTSIDSFADVETALATKADLTDLAPAFSTATAYTVGKYVSYEGNIYKCTSAHSAGAWVAGDFTLVAVGSELESKQDKTDNNLQTTDKTVVGAINSLKSGLTNYENQNNLNLEVPNRKNVAGLSSFTNENNITFTADNSTGTVSASGSPLYSGWAAGACFTKQLPAGKYIVSCATNPNDLNVLIGMASQGVITTAGVEITVNAGDIVRLAWSLTASESISYTATGVMIRPAFITDSTFTPYIPSVETRLEDTEAAVKLNTQDLTTPSRTANIAISTFSDSTDVSQYSVALYVDCDLKPNTTYTLSFDGTNGARYYTNENLFASQSTVTVGSDRAVLTVTTKSTISKAGNTYTSGKGWIILKNSITEPVGHAFTDVQFEIGSSATPYSVYTPSVETRLDAVERLIVKTSETVQTNANGTGRLSITFDQARLVYVAAVTISATIAIPFLTGDHTWAVKVMEADDLAPVQDGVLIAYGYIVNR